MDPCVFFDLQGTLGGPPGGDITEFVFYPCAFEAVRLLRDHGVATAILTNQSHISKGVITQEQADQYADRVLRQLAERDCPVGGIYICPHRDEDGCDCKKPRPALLLRAAQDLCVTPSISYVVGDIGMSDMLLARAVGAKAVLVRTGFGEGSLAEFRHTWEAMEPDYVARDALDAALWALRDMGRAARPGRSAAL